MSLYLSYFYLQRIQGPPIFTIQVPRSLRLCLSISCPRNHLSIANEGGHHKLLPRQFLQQLICLEVSEVGFLLFKLLFYPYLLVLDLHQSPYFLKACQLLPYFLKSCQPFPQTSFLKDIESIPLEVPCPQPLHAFLQVFLL